MKSGNAPGSTCTFPIDVGTHNLLFVSTLRENESYPTSKRAGDNQLACELPRPRGSRCHSQPLRDLQVVCRGLNRRPSACLRRRHGLYPTILSEDNTEVVVEEGRENLWKGSVSAPYTIQL